ncbi:MAG: hypothetical protein OEV80_13890, partial [candidate division Zixibacteria bacterium]|nr:hypothetical protein [candidate division Zixibacteria bacterium]
IARAGRHKALLCLILLLTLAAVADRFCLQTDQATGDSSRILTTGIPSSDSDPGNRASTSAPSGDDSAAQLVPFVLQKDNGPGRTKLRRGIGGRSPVWSDTDVHVGALCTTAPMIDTKLSRQFTLVGARPSGTS